MRRIESKKLNLHKETLRTLATDQLVVVAGATAFACGVIAISPALDTGAANGCVIVSDRSGSVSFEGLGSNCTGPPIPNPSDRINPSLIIGH
jgi:hypothetical protein